MPTVYTPFDVTDRQLKKSAFTDRACLTQWICNELDLALSARSGDEREIKYAWALYQQDRTRGRSAPWAGAADLTSPYAAEYVDALHARLMTIIFTEPVWTIEGFGPSAIKAPFVEEFHQRAQEEERFQGYADELILRALVEGSGVVEISENVDMRRETTRKRVKLKLHEGQPVLEDGDPALEQDDSGQYLEAQGEEPSADVDVDALEPVRVGPAYDVVPALDFLTLPGHARDRTQVWGHAKRLYRRVPELAAKARMGVYDRKAVEALGTDNERQTKSDEAPAQHTIVTQDGPTAQKELWDLQLLIDCDGRGERWYRATVSKDRLQLLRLKRDDRTTRYAQFTPFPKPGTVGRGYSLISHKMRTVIEEDTAIRNLRADKAAFKASQPMLRQVGALWDPMEQPIGPGRVLDVRDKNEVSVLQGIEDVPASVHIWKQDVRTDGDRLLGTNDTALGQDTSSEKTLGEVQLRAGYSEVRMNVILKRLSEALEEVWLARHAIWKRTLQERQGMTPSRAMVVGQMAQGVDVQGVGQDGLVTPDLLEGTFWAKPKGSVETADLNRQRQDFNSMLTTLPALAQMNPTIAAIFATVPAAKSLVKTMLKVNRVQDVQSFIGPEQGGVFDQMQQQQQMAQMQADPRMQLVTALMSARDGAAPMGEGMAGGAPAGDPMGSPPVM